MKQKSSEINPCQLIFDKGDRSIKWSKNSLFNKWCWDIWTYEKNETRPPTYTVPKNNSRWTEDLNISHDTIKVLEENIGRKISDIPLSNIFIDMSPRARDIKERINKRDLMKIKIFCMADESNSKMKREPII